MNDKNSIRKKIKILRRKNYSLDENASWKAAKNFFFYFKKNIKSIGLYWPMLYELDTRPLIKLLLEKKIDIYLPSVSSNQLKFFQWKLNDTLTFNKLKFYEPKQKSIQKTPSLILVPTLAFDKNGVRLGYGKGFYDRFFEKNKSLFYLGYGYEFQEVNYIPSEHFDLRCNTIITNESIKVFKS